MDQDLQARLNKLLEQQKSFQDELKKLGDRNAGLEEELERLVWEAQASVEQQPTKQVEDTPPIAPPPLPKQADWPKPKPEGEPISAVAKATPEERKQQHVLLVTKPEVKPAPPKPKRKEFNTGEWELNFGRVWLVRIGVVLLLTGLIFLSTYAYKNWLFNAGAAVKVTFFMVISLTLTGAGVWLENWRKGFRQYGRVLASGGLAAGYYTIYAAHFVPSLKLIDSPILEGVLLTLWAGVMLGYAVWKKSRIVAVMAIGLAFYGTIVNPSGWLALFSALLLSSAGIWLMLRYRWVSIGLGVVAAAYASHAFWLGLYPGEVAESVRLTYLGCYWILFTAALMVPQARQLPEKIQRWMIALNNSAAWYLTVFSIPSLIPHAQIGWISLGMGVLWLGLAAVARTGKLWHQSLAVIFGYQGLMIASLGVLIEATGYTRFLVLAVEACVLMHGARHFGGVLARGASALVFFTAMITAFPEMNGGILAPWLSYAGLAAVCAAYTGIVRRDEEVDGMLAIIPACITWLVLGAGVFNQWQTPYAINGIWILAVAVMFASTRLKKFCRLPGLQDLAMISVPVAFISGWWYLREHNELLLWQSLVPLIGTGVFWYMSPRLSTEWDEMTRNVRAKKSTALEWVFSILLWLMVATTAAYHVQDGAGWMVIGGVLAIFGHGMAQLFKRSSIGGPALVFHLPALVSLVEYGNIHPLAGWAPALLLAVHLALVDRGWKLLDGGVLMGSLAFCLACTVGVHAFQDFDRPDLTLTALGLAMTAWSFRRRETTMMMAGAVFPLLVACLSSVMIHGARDWLRYLPILSALLLHAFLWRETKTDDHWKPSRVILLITGLVTLIFASTIHVVRVFDGSGLAICWALLASLLFCAGLAIRCRPYRLIGIWWLAAAVLHVVCIDVMRLETLGRILSFITLGLVLLAFGFLYNKFQETIRKFL